MTVAARILTNIIFSERILKILCMTIDNLVWYKSVIKKCIQKCIQKWDYKCSTIVQV